MRIIVWGGGIAHGDWAEAGAVVQDIRDSVEGVRAINEEVGTQRE